MSNARIATQDIAAGVVTIVLCASGTVAQDCGEGVDFGRQVDVWDFHIAADCGVAVGPDHIMTTSKLGRWAFPRGGGNPFAETMDDFFDRGQIEFAADPVCAFDSATGTYFILAMSSLTSLAMGVSQSSDPVEGDWWFHEWDDLDGNVDYPSMSVCEDHVFLTYYRPSGQNPGRAAIAFTGKADLMSSETPELTIQEIGHINGQDNDFRQIGCMKMYDQPSSSIGYLLTDSHTTSGTNDKIRLYALDAADNTLSTYDLTVPEYLTVPQYLAIPGERTVLCNKDFKYPVYRNGSAWAAHAIGKSGESDTAKVRWYEIAMNGWPDSQDDPELVQSGTIDVAPGVSTWFPVIHVDDDDNAAIAYNQCSPEENISIRRRIRKWYDDEGMLRADLILNKSDTSTLGDPHNPNWVDYSGMDEDSEHPGVMWSHLQFAEEVPGTPPPTYRKTWLARTDLNKSLTLEIDWPEEEIPRETPVTLTVTGAAPGNLVRWYYSFYDCGETYIGDPMYVTLEISSAVFLGSSYDDGDGMAEKNFTVPANFPLGEVHVQAAELENIS